MKEPERRFTIEEVFQHPFWNGKLKLDNDTPGDKVSGNVLSKMSEKEPTVRSVDTAKSFDSNRTLTESMMVSVTGSNQFPIHCK